MPSTITGILSSPYLTLWQVYNNDNNNNVFTLAGNVITFTAQTHPFSTGDTVYFMDYDLQVAAARRYVIKISDTQISCATSYANAINGIVAAIPLNPGRITRASIANVPITNSIYDTLNINAITDAFVGYSKSTQSFSVTDNASIDFTVPSWSPGVPSGLIENFPSALWAFGLISDVGSYKLGLLDAVSLRYGDSVSGTITNLTSKSSLTFNFRILIQNQRASIQIKTTANTYLTLFTSSVLGVNIQGLRFFASLGLNGVTLTNCTIAYL